MIPTDIVYGLAEPVGCGVRLCAQGVEADNVAGSIFMPDDKKLDRTRVNWARARHGR